MGCAGSTPANGASPESFEASILSSLKGNFAPGAAATAVTAVCANAELWKKPEFEAKILMPREGDSDADGKSTLLSTRHPA